MSSHSTEISVTARYNALPDLMAELASQAQALGLAEADIGRLQLVVEELFTNTISHGHGGDSDATVRCSLCLDDRGAHLQYSDHARPFDITTYVPDSAPEIGGLGIPLIRGMTRAIRYQRRDDGNLTELDF